MGVCGTDVEIADGLYGWAPPGRERIILGHESLGRVIDPGTSGFAVGDHVVGIVRRPDPVPCPNCAVGEWDMCSNGRYTERGIKLVDGFMSDRWRIEPEYAVKVDTSLGLLGVLLEPTTVVAKAWEHVANIGRRSFWDPSTVFVVGAGPIGLLAALIGVQYGGDVHVLDRATSGPKPALVEALGATYHTRGGVRARAEPRRRRRMHRGRATHPSCRGYCRARRDRVPHRGRSTGARRRRRIVDAHDRRGAQEPGGVRLRERKPPPLLPRGAGAGQGGPLVARTARHSARAPPRDSIRPSSASRTTSRS